MNQRPSPTALDTIKFPSELRIRGVWDSASVAGLIRSKSSIGETPAFLFVGRHEALLLRNHLAAAFGADAVPTINDTYYMGLKVIELNVETYIRAAGRKTLRTLQDPISRRPAWQDEATDSLWQFRLGA